VVGSRAYGKR